jgi:hypothetical protein
VKAGTTNTAAAVDHKPDIFPGGAAKVARFKPRFHANFRVYGRTSRRCETAPARQHRAVKELMTRNEEQPSLIEHEGYGRE